MTRHQGSTRAARLPRVAALAAISLLALGQVPLAGLDHLHLHVTPGLKLFHDHLNIGHHEHGDYHHDAEPAGDDRDNDGSDDSRPGTTVVSYGQSAQLRPSGVEIPAAAPPAGGQSIPPAHQPVRSGSIHPSWDSRAPPV